MQEILYWAAAIITAGGALGTLWTWIRLATRQARKMDRFLEDWSGTDARPGRPAVPGVMQRLVDLEDGLTSVRHEVFPNSGGSLRDAVDRLERCLQNATPPPVIPAQRTGVNT